MIHIYYRLFIEAAPGFFFRVGSVHPIFGSIAKVTSTRVTPILICIRKYLLHNFILKCNFDQTIMIVSYLQISFRKPLTLPNILLLIVIPTTRKRISYVFFIWTKISIIEAINTPYANAFFHVPDMRRHQDVWLSYSRQALKCLYELQVSHALNSRKCNY